MPGSFRVWRLRLQVTATVSRRYRKVADPSPRDRCRAATVAVSDVSAKRGARPMAQDQERALTLRLPEELHRELQERAEREERSIAGVLRMAARMYLSQS